MAMAQGRSFLSWSLAAALLSPVVVLLLFILPKPDPTKQPTATPKVVLPPRLPAPERKAALPMRAIRALAYRVESGRIAGWLSGRKTVDYRSLDYFTAAGEIDKGIAAAVHDEFPHGPARQTSAKRKPR
jgi:hypothetical protein